MTTNESSKAFMTWIVGTPTEHAAAVDALIGSGWAFCARTGSEYARPGTSIWTKGRSVYVVYTVATH